MMVEIHLNGTSYWMWAECPNKSMEDIKNMAIESDKRFTASISKGAMALYDEIPNVKPMDITDLLRQAEEKDITRHDLKGPEFDINYFFKVKDISHLRWLDPIAQTERAMPTWKWENITEIFSATF